MRETELKNNGKNPDLKGQYGTAIVLGAGKSGVAAVRFLLAKGLTVALYDENPAAKPVYGELRALGCEIILGEVPDVSPYRLAVISPGMPLTAPIAVALKAAHIPVWGELELASRFIEAPIIGITGTNGKTTTTTLVGEIFKNAGYRTFVGGNIGIPLLESLKEEYDYYVVEMSSFQLETVETMNATVSLYLNLTPDHLNRHGDMNGYLDAKAKMAEKQTSDHYTVLNVDDEYMSSLSSRAGGKIFGFSRRQKVYFGSYVYGNSVIFQGHAEDRNIRVMDKREIRIPGPHNLENALAAITAAKIMGIEEEIIAETLKTFGGVEHRLEDVMTYRGVRYVNDSKGTNPDAVFKALASYGDAPIVLIAGGRNKGNNFDELGKLIKKKCKYLVLIGEAAAEMKASAEKAEFYHIAVAEDMAAAVAKAAAEAEKGDVVLLSPANASFDMFDSFEHRGKVFKDIVLKLRKGKTYDLTKAEAKST